MTFRARSAGSASATDAIVPPAIATSRTPSIWLAGSITCPPCRIMSYLALSIYELRARRCLRGLGVAKDILVRTRDRMERYRDVPASLEAQMLSRGRLLYADPQRGIGAELAGQSPARSGYGS